MPEQTPTEQTPSPAAPEKQPPVQDSLSTALGNANREFDGKSVAVEPEEGPVGHPAIDAPLDPQLELPLEQPPAQTETTPTAEPDPDKWQPKYKDHQAAEDAVAEAQRKITEQSLKLSETNELLLKEIARKAPEPATTQPVATPAEAVDFVKDCRRKAIDKIESLDPDASDYKDLVATIQADADKDVQGHYRKQDRLDFDARQNEQEAANVTQLAIGKALTSSGLDSAATSVDYMLFNHFANDYTIVGDKLVDQDRSILTQSQAIEKTIEKVIKYNQSALEKYKLEQAQKLAAQKQGNSDQPLERGAGGPETIAPQSPPPPVKPVTLGGLLDNVQQARVI